MQAKKAVTSAATMVPLAIALLHNAVVAPKPGAGPAPVLPTTVAAAKCNGSIEDFLACHSEYPTGCSPTGNYDPYLNLMKNQTKWRASSPQAVFTSLQQLQDLEAKLPPNLGKSNHGGNMAQLAGLGEGNIHGVVGYLYDIQVEGQESSNCELDKGTDNRNVDYHIFIGFDPLVAEKIRTNKPLTPEEHKSLKQQSVVVEMTPHYRDEFHPEWTADAVKAQKGKQVKVLGQLMVDNEHYVAGQDCGHANSTASCWRATVWELHPVTDFEVCDAGDCKATTTAGWSPIGQGGSESAAASGEQPAPKRHTASQ